jgi:hypothetical protein
VRLEEPRDGSRGHRPHACVAGNPHIQLQTREFQKPRRSAAPGRPRRRPARSRRRRSFLGTPAETRARPSDSSTARSVDLSPRVGMEFGARPTSDSAASMTGAGRRKCGLSRNSRNQSAAQPVKLSCSGYQPRRPAARRPSLRPIIGWTPPDPQAKIRHPRRRVPSPCLSSPKPSHDRNPRPRRRAAPPLAQAAAACL